MSFEHYKSLSRFTDPGTFVTMLEELPRGPNEICYIAKAQTIHHNLLGYFQISETDRKSMARVWPPRITDLLKVLKSREPNRLDTNREPKQRVIGACILESHFLAGMLRQNKIPVRIRAGYFKELYSNPEHVLRFWEQALKARGMQADLFHKDPASWRKNIDDFTNKQISDNHRIEHWACEYWNPARSNRTLLDANNTFLKAHSNIDVPFELPTKYFEYSFESWAKMRSNPHFNQSQYEEEPQDGRSHIRSQMLSDLFSLLNHDVVGQAELSVETSKFVKGRKYDELKEKELKELDMLSRLLSKSPNIGELTKFYRSSTTLRLNDAENDPYSFLTQNFATQNA